MWHFGYSKIVCKACHFTSFYHFHSWPTWFQGPTVSRGLSRFPGRQTAFKRCTPTPFCLRNDGGGKLKHAEIREENPHLDIFISSMLGWSVCVCVYVRRYRYVWPDYILIYGNLWNEMVMLRRENRKPFIFVGCVLSGRMGNLCPEAIHVDDWSPPKLGRTVTTRMGWSNRLGEGSSTVAEQIFLFHCCHYLINVRRTHRCVMYVLW